MTTPAVPMARPLTPALPAAGRSLPITGQVIPSFPLVGSHFALGFGWALAGAVGLVWLAPQLATGSFLDPRVLALTHLCTLGFLTTVITGVLYQVFPAMLGIGIDEDMAVLITDGRRLEIVGPTHVMFVDPKKVKGGMAVYFLKAGDVFDIRKRKTMAK